MQTVNGRALSAKMHKNTSSWPPSRDPCEREACLHLFEWPPKGKLFALRLIADLSYQATRPGEQFGAVAHHRPFRCGFARTRRRMAASAARAAALSTEVSEL